MPFYCFLTDVEDIIVNKPNDILPPYNVYVYNINGQMILSQENVMKADISALNAGLYIIQYEKNGQRVAKKVIR